MPGKFTIRTFLVITGLFTSTLHYGQSQIAYFKGMIRDEFQNPVAYVTIKLIDQNKIFTSGATGEFGIPSEKVSDSAWFFVQGFDTLRTRLTREGFNTYFLNISAATRQNLIRAASLSHDSFEELNTKTFSPIYHGSETYLQLAENNRFSPSLHPDLRYIPNNNTASLTNIRRMSRQRVKVPPDAVRIEEMWNYYQLRFDHNHSDLSHFGLASQLSTCPWDSSRLLLMLNAISPTIQFADLPPANMVFLIDNSGSMSEKNRLEVLKAGFKTLAYNLRPQDRVGIVTYGGTPGIHLWPTSGTEKLKIISAIDSLEAGGSTQGSNGIHLAYQLATTDPFPDGTNTIVLATDGDFNVGAITESELEDMISRYRSTGVPLSCIGVGMGNYKDSKIELLAKLGRGNFGYVETDEEADRTLMNWYTKGLYTTAKEVMLHIKFDSSVVEDYRIIGYNNKSRSLQSPVRNILGSDMGADQSSVALFEILLKDPEYTGQFIKPGSWGIIYRKSLYDTGVTRVEEILEKPVLEWSNTDSSFKAASLLAQLGYLLRKMPANPNAAFDELETNLTSWFHVDDPFRADMLLITRNLKETYCPPSPPAEPQKPVHKREKRRRGN